MALADVLRMEPSLSKLAGSAAAATSPSAPACVGPGLDPLGHRRHATLCVCGIRDKFLDRIGTSSCRNIGCQSRWDEHAKLCQRFTECRRTAFRPKSGKLWAAANELDDSGDDVPSDFFTYVMSGGLHGWPCAYLVHVVDDRVASQPDLIARAIAPDLRFGA